MEKINQRLYDLFTEELKQLELGHGYNYERLSYMRAMITLLLYLRYATLEEADIYRVLSTYDRL